VTEENPNSGDISTEPTVQGGVEAFAQTAAGEPAAEEAHALEIGTSFGEYRIEGLLGRGGMGVVYRARHQTLDRRVALKVLRFGQGGQAPEQAHQAAAVKAGGGAGHKDPRFLREARNTARLDHHNIVAVNNAGYHDGQLFIEMELVDGASLSNELRTGPLDAERATRIVEQVAHALNHAHSRGVIHRDIKPDNVLLTPDDVVKVTDFGLAKQPEVDTMLTAPGSILGTPSYMAPEQWRGDPSDARTDIYALGGTYFHLVTGQPPFRGTLPDLMAQHVGAEAPTAHEVKPGLPAEVSEVIARLMAKRPEDRPQSAAEVVTELRQLQRSFRRTDEEKGATGEAAAAPIAPQTTALVSPAPTPGALRRPGGLLLAAVWIAVVALIVALDQLGAWDRLEMSTLDHRMVSRSAAPVSGDVALVLVDNKTVRELGMPFDRDHLVDVIEALNAAGARAVALDLLIADRGPGSGDLDLATVSESARGLIHAADLYRSRGPGQVLVPPARFAVSTVRPDGLLEVNRATLPIPMVLENGRLLGNVGLLVDGDGLIRRVPLLVRFGDRVFPALSLVAACQGLGARLEDVRFRPGEPLTIARRGADPVVVPLDRQAAMRISVRGTLESRTPASFLEILRLARSETRAARDKLRRRYEGKVIVVGMAASGQRDIQPMPGLLAPPLVIAHAMAVETILGQDFVRIAGWPWLVALVLVLAAVALLGGLRLPWYVLVPSVAAAVFLYWLGASATLGGLGLALPVVAPCLALVVGGAAGWGVRLRAEQRQRRLLSEALGRYLPRRVSDQILADDRALKLGGQRKELSIVVVRLQGFGALSEKLEPEEVGELLARLFASVAEVVTRHEGSLDRFSGEGVRAFFGDPVPCVDHAEHAVRCALSIRAEAQGLLSGWASAGRPCPPLGIGVHTGYVTVGNIGAVQRMEYTVLGRNVEIAEELAAAAPSGTVLASERTRALTDEGFIFERASSGGGVKGSAVCAPR
jgi:class 3 adenylate cyclase/predicted Ser/Thr protein kinase